MAQPRLGPWIGSQRTGASRCIGPDAGSPIAAPEAGCDAAGHASAVQPGLGYTSCHSADLFRLAGAL